MSWKEEKHYNILEIKIVQCLKHDLNIVDVNGICDNWSR